MVRRAARVVFALALLAFPPVARAEPDARPSPPAPPDGTLALVAGGATLTGGLIAGSVLTSSHQSQSTPTTIGWVVMSSTFVAAPIVAHGVNREWLRGLVFASPALLGLGATTGTFIGKPDSATEGWLRVERVLWISFGVGLAAATAGVVDAGLVESRWSVAPTVDRSGLGLQMGRAL